MWDVGVLATRLNDNSKNYIFLANVRSPVLLKLKIFLMVGFKTLTKVISINLSINFQEHFRKATTNMILTVTFTF